MNSPIIRQLYLDNAATSFPKPESVYEASDQYMRQSGAAFGRGAHSSVDDAVHLVAECRRRVALILGASSSSEVAFTFNCTDGLNLLLRGILAAGDRVVTSTLEHNSVLRPLRQLQQEMELEVVHVDFDVNTGLIDEAAMVQQIQLRPTRLVVMNHASNVTGIVQPAQRLCKATHEAGALFLLDAAQTVGHLPFCVNQLGVDMLATAGHKGLLGPLGTGLVYIKAGIERQLRPIRSGGTGTSSESIVQPKTMPTMLESGNLNMPGLAGLNASTKWLIEQDISKLHQHIAAHTERLQVALAKLNNVTVHCSESGARNVGIVSFVIQGMDSREAAMILDQAFHIQCRAGLQCAPLIHKALKTEANGGSIRLSPGPFTTSDDIELTIESIYQICSTA